MMGGCNNFLTTPGVWTPIRIHDPGPNYQHSRPFLKFNSYCNVELFPNLSKFKKIYSYEPLINFVLWKKNIQSTPAACTVQKCCKYVKSTYFHLS